MLTQAEIRSLSASNHELGWAAVPNACPERFVRMICEHRKAVLSGEKRNAAAPQPKATPVVNAEVTASRELYEKVRVF